MWNNLAEKPLPFQGKKYWFSDGRAVCSGIYRDVAHQFPPTHWCEVEVPKLPSLEENGEKPAGDRFVNDQKWQYTEEGREFFAALADAPEKGRDRFYCIGDNEVSEAEFYLKGMEKLAGKRKGIKHDDGKIRFDLLDPHGLESIAEVFTHGALEYEPKGYLSLKKHRIEAALMRHTNLARQGVKIDTATKQSHWASVAANAMILMEMERKNE